MRLLPLAAAVTVAALMPSAAHAAAVVIWPVDPVIKPDEQATALWLENKGTTPVTLQVRTLAWSQPGGEERLDQQDQVVASPPIATVAPGARQLVRIIRRTPVPAPEGAYRLLVDELPPPPADGPDAAPQARLSVQMRYSIPLFTFAGAPPAPHLDAEIASGAGGRVLTIHNTGSGHARLTDLRLVTGSREIGVRAGLAGYVLAGATVSIPLGAGEAGAVKVGVNGVDQILGTAI